MRLFDRTSTTPGAASSHLLALVASVALVALPATSAAQGTDATNSPDAEAERLATEAAEADRTAVGVAKVGRLSRYGGFLPRSSYRKLLESAADRALDPLVEFRFRRRLARLLRGRGDPDAADGALEGQGCLTDWSVAGPFDNNTMQAFERRLPPEEGETGPYRGKVTEVDWRPLPDFDRGCVYRLGRTLQPSTSAVAYLAASVDADRARDARLLVGAQGAYKIWVDGELVAREKANLGLGVDNQAWRIALDEGENRILVKVASRSSGSLGFVARLVGSDLQPLDSTTVSGGWEPRTVEESAAGEGDSGEGVETTGEGVLSRAEACAAEGGDSATAWCAWIWRRAAPAKAASPWRDVADRLAKPILDPDGGENLALSARDLVRIASLFDNRGRRLEIVERARERAPDDPWVGLALASAYQSSLGRLNRSRDRPTLEVLRREHSGFWPATLELADWYDGNGYAEKALRLVRSIEVEDRLQRPAILRRLADLESNAGTEKRARELRGRLAEVAATSGGWAWQRLKELTTRGKTRRALELVRERLRLYPLSRRWGLKEVELLRAAGEADDALVRLDEWIEKVPGEVRFRRHKARLLVAADRREDAVAVLEEAVRIDPQNERLDEYLSYLQTDRRSFHDPWMIEDVRSVAEQHPPGSFSDDTVIDQTIVRVAPNGLSQRVVQRVDRAITSEGVEAARNLSVSYTRGDERVEVIDVEVYKRDGTVLEDYDQWRSGRSKKSGPYYNDQRYLNIQANNVEKGDLVEYRYRVREVANENFRGDYFGDLSYVQAQRPTGFSRYAVEFPEDWKLYFRRPKLEHESLGPKRPDGTPAGPGYRVRGFELEEVPAVKTDPRQPGYAEVYDYILVSNKKTWDEVGQWWWNLIEEQLIVNDAIARTVDEVTKGLESDRAKVEALHRYVVKNTRYLHVGLGIHGWKPYRTTQCFQNKYGDCKDKSSLLKVMLEEAGIETNLVLVRTRRLGKVGEKPPSMHIFNHAIDYIPSMDLFIDPTAEFNGTEELPPMDQGAQALIVKDGGETKFTTLPIDGADDNLLVREIDVDLSKDPTVATGDIVARGQNAVYYRRSLENPERRDEVFEKQLSEIYPGAELVSARYEHLDALDEPVEIHFEFKGGRLERSSNERSFLFPYGAPKDLLSRYADEAERDQDLTIRIPFANETEMRYRIPPDRGVERIPESVKLRSEFGSLTIEYEKRDGAFVADIRYSIDAQRVPVEKYPEFRSFLSKATSALNESIGLVEESASD